MEIRELWRIVERRWWLMALPAVVALALAIYGYLTTPSGGGFAASMTFTAAAPPQGQTLGYEDKEYYPWLSSEYVVNALTDWVRTGSFAEEVSAVLVEQDREIPAGAIRAGIAADNTRSIMTVSVSGGDPATVAAIASAAADVLETRSAAYFPQMGENGVEVVALDQPSVGPVPPPLSARLEPLVRFGLGLAAGVALAFLVEYLDPSIHTRREVEALGLDVLAEIPKR